MAHKDDVGRWGETFAVDYLARCGIATLAQNLRTLSGEVDIVCVENRTLVVAEVKTRTTQKAGVAGEAIDPKRIARLSQAALQVLQSYPEYQQVRVDALLIDVMPNVVRIEHVRGIS